MSAGRHLEDFVKGCIERLLASGQLGLDGRYCAVHRQKGYYSAERGKPIITDVSIEVQPPNTKQPALLWIWECKDYSNSVPVDDVEEFHAKLQQIGQDNTKGTIVTTSRFQESALAFAHAKKIGLTRVVKRKKIEPIGGMWLPQPNDLLTYNALICESEAVCRMAALTGNHRLDRFCFSLSPHQNWLSFDDCLTNLLIGTLARDISRDTT